MTKEWRNWSGNVRFRPARIEEPADEQELAQAVQRAAADGHKLRAAGDSHSFTPLLETEGVLVTTSHFHGVVDVDKQRMQATMRAGTEIGELGPALREQGVTLIQLGDIDYQTIAGGMATATHGTGARLPHLGAPLAGGRMVNGRGEIVEFDADRNPELLRAMRASLGLLGVMTEVRLAVRPVRRLRRREWCLSAADLLDQLGGLGERYERVDVYWYPRRDEFKVRTWVAQESAADEPAGGTLVKDETGWSDEVLPSPQENRYEEMEYMIPAEAGPECLDKVRRRILERHRSQVAWRVLYRWIAGDDAHLSPMYGRDSVSIALLQNVDLPFEPYFRDMEPIFWEHDGRPHWAKRHGVRGEALRGMYPDFESFARLRAELDPTSVFLNSYLAELAFAE